MTTSTQPDRDPEILDAYERLSRSLEAPVDGLARVERRMRVRRRRRVAVTGSLAAVALLAGGTTAVLALGGRDGSTPSHVADAPTGPVSTLSFTRADGTTYTFDHLDVACRKDPDSGRELITLTSPRKVRGDTLLEPFLMFQASFDEVATGRTFTLPVDGETSKAPMILFFATDEGGPRANELSSAEQSTGTVLVVGASCAPTPSLKLKVDATLGSEVQQAPMRIAGEFGS